MAIYHFSVKIISRSSGRSATAAAAYRSGEYVRDERQGRDHDYTNRGGVLHTEILLPENAPSWMGNRSDLWNGVEASEKRKDARLSREIVVALPHELTDDQRLELVRGFAQEQFVARGMVADVAVHSPGAEGDERNHHAHIMLTTRSIDEDGFGKKAREWNAKDLLEGWRSEWADVVNHALEAQGHDLTVDHRSLSEQRDHALQLQAEALELGDEGRAQSHEIDALELDREPLPDIGWKAWAMERSGERTLAGDQWRQAKEGLEAVRETVSDLRDSLAGFARDSIEKVRGFIMGDRETDVSEVAHDQGADDPWSEDAFNAAFDEIDMSEVKGLGGAEFVREEAERERKGRERTHENTHQRERKGQSHDLSDIERVERSIKERSRSIADDDGFIL